MSRESFAEGVLLEALAGARTLRSSAPEYDRALIDNLMAMYGHLLDFVGVLHRESRQFVEAERVALERAEFAERLLAVADAENARLNARVQELESVAREAARS